jgi:CMP-N,N'-diacetyllegionaminic acid synthase
MRNILVVIPARGGSKGIPRKNVKLLAGKPLITYAIEEAKKALPEAYILVSSEDEEIIQVAKDWGANVPFVRPEHLASDTASTYDVLIHALDWYERQHDKVEAIVLIQPTSPFRKATHIREAVEMYKEEWDMVVSVKETDANPYYVLFEENEEGYLAPSKEANFTRRQDCPIVYEYNGAVYVINPEALRKAGSMRGLQKIRKYVMPNSASLDLDTQLDWDIAEWLIQKSILP